MWVHLLTILSVITVLTFKSEVVSLAEKLKYEGRCRSDDECNWNKNHHCREPTAKEIANSIARAIVPGKNITEPNITVHTTPPPEHNPGGFRSISATAAATTEAHTETTVATLAPSERHAEAPVTAAGAAPPPSVTTLSPDTQKTTLGPLPDDGKVVAGEKRCLCLPDTKVDTAAKGNPDCLSIYAFLDDPCGSVAVPNEEKPRVCAASANLECEDLVPTQFSKCRCTEGAIPNIYSRICTLPPRTIALGQPCRDAAPAEEEICEGDYTICQNGTCSCDVEDPAVAKDDRHGDCYLKVNPRHAKPSSASRVRAVRLNNWGNERKKNRKILEKIFDAFCFMCFTNTIFVFEEIFSTVNAIWIV